ncbi:endolytic transglycosylase MltG [Salibacterium aidingense]|uniref:endolytic transglycosylase MltG n=1 Tax=Salibacterium aidingense TaxID=384933 RepID=UPI000415062C|nr:endolytic transglycosylase MltG [Salibacterium aidingense]
MNRKSIQIFAFGWFAAACCLAAVYFIWQPQSSDRAKEDFEETPVPQENSMEEKEMIASLESSGYTVLSADELAELQEEKDSRTEEQKPPETKVKTILHIEEGMASGDVASHLQSLEIIESADSFQEQLQESGAATSIQSGEYELNSTMTPAEIIDLISS